MMKRFSIAVVFFIALSIPYISMAWGTQGHRITGEIANSYLTKKARKAIIAILGNESIAMSSNWADFVKSDTGYRYLSNWHYINLPAALTKNAVENFLAADTATDVYTKINWLTEQLKNKLLSSDKQQLYLRVLIHLVEDVHQPMHVGRPDDLGGNRVTVNWFSEASNLHQVWDSKLIDFQQLSYTEYVAAINFTTKQQRKQWMAEPVSEWIWQSYQQAEKIYAGVKTGDRLGFDYNYKYIATLNEQLLKAGVHLAGLLNSIFG
ncbi:S1/P1 nuclease [Lacibacter cauensis]|uniref:S1/P1 nuclease n=1 Tax=Lacibacter cauensis TaxID=510947 RepID=A0A562SJV3_9BACT|nr:S1/P1 nuclease [Lacibacter cauensis]TWI81070.1 S1/P1 nuclease [Lacibacter cauensis]